jgi:hypothetical protein
VLPVITNVPVPQTVAQGGTAIFSITAGPIHPLLPLTYRWLRQGAAYATTSIPVLVITNCQPALSGSFRCQVVNARGNASTSGANLLVLPDFDGDGIGDQWETNYPGFSTNNIADGALDFDNDGMSNRDEFIAGTNPTNAASVLRLVLSTTNANVLTFVAQSNKFYTVQARTNLTLAPWTTVTNFVGSTSVRTATVNSVSPPQEIERYYRILTPGIP